MFKAGYNHYLSHKRKRPTFALKIEFELGDVVVSTAENVTHHASFNH